MTHHGFVCANAGVDASNVPGEDAVVLLPEDPDESARRLRAGLRDRVGAAPAILITDSFGRAWRHGQVDVAIGCAGLRPTDDWRGRTDATGRELKATWIATADELAAAADLARTKDGALPLILIRGAGRHVTAQDGPGARALDPPGGGRPVPIGAARPAAGARGRRSPRQAPRRRRRAEAPLGDSPRISAASATEPTGCTVSISEVIAAGQPRQRGRDQQPAEHLRGQREDGQPRQPPATPAQVRVADQQPGQRPRPLPRRRSRRTAGPRRAADPTRLAAAEAGSRRRRPRRLVQTAAPRAGARPYAPC